MNGYAGEIEQETQSELCVVPIFKARPATEGDERFIYVEPSTEDWDIQGERIVMEALIKAAPYFLKFGVFDIGHFSMPDMRVIAEKHGFTDPVLARVGHPVDVRIGSEGTLICKARLYRGDSKSAEQANKLWDRLELGAREYPSIGGRSIKTCDDSGCTLRPILWSNVGLWPEPINLMVKAVSTMPWDVFAKALVAGAVGTDIATLTGGAALRRQSLHGAVVETASPVDEDRYYKAATAYLRGDACPHREAPKSEATIKAHFRDCGGFDDSAAAAAADRLIWEIATVLGTNTNRDRLAA